MKKLIILPIFILSIFTIVNANNMDKGFDFSKLPKGPIASESNIQPKRHIPKEIQKQEYPKQEPKIKNINGYEYSNITL